VTHDNALAYARWNGLDLPSEAEAKRFVIKGGSFLCAPNYCMCYRAGSREGQEGDLAASHLDFRYNFASDAPAVTLTFRHHLGFNGTNLVDLDAHRIA
jgi:hypothetical protein